MDRDPMGFVVDDPKVSQTDNTAFFLLSFMEPVDADIDSKIPWKGLSAFIYLIIEAYHSYKGIFLQELIREASLFFEGGRTVPDYYFWKLIKWEKYSPEIAHEIFTSVTLFKHFFPDNGADNTEENCWSTVDLKSAFDVACNEGRIVGRYDHIFVVAEREFDDCCSGTLVTLCYNVNKVMVLDSHEEFLMQCTVHYHFGMDFHWLNKKNDVVYEPSFLPEPSPRPEDNPNKATCCICPRTITPRRKIQKDSDAEPTQIEETAARTLFELENTSQALKSDLKDIFINAAVEIDISGNRKAVVIYVPRILRMAFRKIHSRLVMELEKKFGGKDVVMIAARASNRGSDVQRPGSRTLSALYKAMLEDIVYPAEIVYRSGGSNITKIYLDPKERTNTEYKLETFSGVYKMLSQKDVVFEYAVTKA